MKLPWLRSALENEGPYVSVHMDTTRLDPQAATEIETRWARFRDHLASDGVAPALLDAIGETLLTPSPIGGRHGRTVIAAGDRIVVDRVLPVPPLHESAHAGEEPQLLPLLEITPFAVTQLLIEVDRAGADLRLRAPDAPTLDKHTEGLGPDASVDGGHDELHKANLGGGNQHGWRASNSQARVEDSWERNAEAVARTVDRIVREHRPDMVLLTGDVRTSALLKAELGQEVLERLHEVPGGTRGKSLDRPSFREEVVQVTREFIAEREQDLLDRFLEASGRDGAAATGGTDVSQVLDRGQVDELLVVSGRACPDIESKLLQAIRTDAGVSAVREETDGGDVLVDGIGALLRWHDDATPSASIGSMSGDAQRERPTGG
ncbi:hypothetical protein DEO23_14930 [Brachybacterium endophyticum]|uniref:Peptide chain release factor 1 n=1 Tax=Brachybacterium endophyticum TaxID=2182385 RepID=A0A2U2RGU8_9MICO|nr:hypothetical protein [Brachybacterium endophyticum]PWH05087.1 hypothetical protein DEO23_14930 [Brachybacterium endophyticum]